MASKSKVDKKIMALEQKLKLKKEDQQGILLERIRDKEHAEIYTEMLLACENEIAQTQYQINELKKIDETVKKRRKEMKTSIEMLENIIEDGSISDANLRMFVEKIIIFEKDGKLDLQLNLNGQLPYHIDYFDENGTMINKHQEGWWYDSETWEMDVDDEYWDELMNQAM